MGILRARVGGQWVDIGVAQSYPANRNLLDNGAMLVAQRGTSTTSSTAGSRSCVDRWAQAIASNGSWGTSQVGSTVASLPGQAGLSMFHRCAATVAGTIAAGTYNIFDLAIEGRFLQQLLWGTPAAQPVTLSFWVRSAVPGTYIAELQPPGVYCSKSYTINAAATWEYKTVTFPGNTTLTLVDDSSNQLLLIFWLAAGSNYTGGAALGTNWHAVTNTRAVGQVNAGATINNYFDVTGVQLEIGSTATPYEHQPYDDVLRRCMRYFQRWTPPPLRGVSNGGTTASANRMAMVLPVPMRAAPSLVIVSALSVWDGSVSSAVASIQDQYQTAQHVEVNLNTTGALTVNRPLAVYAGTLDVGADI